MDGKSILGILLLAASQGTALELARGGRRRGGGGRGAGGAGRRRLRGGARDGACTGIGVSPGIAVGPGARRRARGRARLPAARSPPEAVEAEVERLARAVGRLAPAAPGHQGAPGARGGRAPRLHLRRPPADARGPAAAATARVAVIREEHVNAEWALRTVVRAAARAASSEFTDAYLRERSTDLDDVLGRIQLNLGGARGRALAGAAARAASCWWRPTSRRRRRPSWTGSACWRVATDAGSRHLPHVDPGALVRHPGGGRAARTPRGASRPGALVVVDGTRGEVVVEPSAPVLGGLPRGPGAGPRARTSACRSTRALPRGHAATACAVAPAGQRRVPRGGGDRALLRRRGHRPLPLRVPARAARGAGRARSGSSRSTARLLEQMRPHPVTVRTWDVGREDLAPGGPIEPEPGARASARCACCARAPEPFRAQLRALLRAGRARAAAHHVPVRDRALATCASALDLLAEARERAARARASRFARRTCRSG